MGYPRLGELRLKRRDGLLRIGNLFFKCGIFRLKRGHVIPGWRGGVGRTRGRIVRLGVLTISEVAPGQT